MIKPNYTDKNGLIAQMTSRDCKELEQLILNNPEAPLLIFCSEDSWNGDYNYESQNSMRCGIYPMTFYNGEWYEKDEYGEVIENDMINDHDYDNFSDEEVDREVDKIIEETAFVNTICVYLG